MADDPATSNGAPGAPAPEVLKPQSSETTAPPANAAANEVKAPKRLRRGSYRPSHRATFIGLAVVVLILAINAGIVAFVLKSQSNNAANSHQDQVTINQSALDKLGVNQTAVGDSGIQLTVAPDAKFNGKLQVGGDVSIAGQLKLNSKFNAADATINQLEAGNTALSQLNVNGDATVSNLNLRKNLIVAGTTTLQGSTTFNQLVTINNGLNVIGNLSVGGALAVNSFQTSNLTIAHIISSGSAPSVSAGSVGSGGTVSISGNDAAGTVAVNTGGGGGGGVLANITFRNRYSNIPHVVVTAIGNMGTGAGSVFVNRSTAGFSIGVSGSLGAGGSYAFDYIVEQ